jgi:hypothetical protein
VVTPEGVFEKRSVLRITRATDRPTGHVPEHCRFAGLSSYTKQTADGNLESVSPPQLGLFYFVVEFRIAGLEFLRRYPTI